uniref:(northern house mosquito) hypothetical protein n=1 Tax=Culex pipiens TaxID=7175 RepID=A0A8D8BWD5_CULPI
MCMCRFNAQDPRHKQQDQGRDSSHRGHYELTIAEAQAETKRFRRRVDAGSGTLLVGTSQGARFTPAEPPRNGCAFCQLGQLFCGMEPHRHQVPQVPGDGCRGRRNAFGRDQDDGRDARVLVGSAGREGSVGNCGVMSVNLVGKVYFE